MHVLKWCIDQGSDDNDHGVGPDPQVLRKTARQFGRPPSPTRLQSPDPACAALRRRSARPGSVYQVPIPEASAFSSAERDETRQMACAPADYGVMHVTSTRRSPPRATSRTTYAYPFKVDARYVMILRRRLISTIPNGPMSGLAIVPAPFARTASMPAIPPQYRGGVARFRGSALRALSHDGTFALCSRP